MNFDSDVVIVGGCGHVGLPLGISLADRGLRVALYDINTSIVPVVNDAFGSLAGFGVLMLAFALVCWRLERSCARGYWHGLREYKY